MPAITKKHTRLKLQFVPNTDHSLRAGLVAVEAMARRFDLWNKLRQLPSLDPRTDQRRGYGPEVLVGQWIYALCSGGGGLSGSGAHDAEPVGILRGETLCGLKHYDPDWSGDFIPNSEAGR